MIAMNTDRAAGLDGVIGAGGLRQSGDVPDFAAMVSAASAVAPQEVTALPMSDMAIALPEASAAALQGSAATSDVDAARAPTDVKEINAFKPIVVAGASPKPAIVEDLPIMNRAAARPAEQNDDTAVTNDGDVAAEPVTQVVVLPAPVDTIALAVVTGEPSPDSPKPRSAKTQAAERVFEKVALPADSGRVAIAVPVIVETIKNAPTLSIEKADVLMPGAIDPRVPTAMPLLLPEKSAIALPDRLPTFAPIIAPIIADAVRDLVALAKDNDVRFNVRPETLGPVAVTIERSDAGPTLRLGVETQAAVQAVRHAEPLLNDARGAAPFVQVSVDLTSPDGRSRTPRATTANKRGRGDIIENSMTGPVSTGRYA